MKSIRTIFAGTPEFACPSLQTLLNNPQVEVCAVYTQPDRPAGRGRKVTASPIKRLAADHALPLYQPENLTADADIEVFKAHGADLFVVAAYGLILPAAVLSLCDPTINVHASVLPRWRGAAPIQRAIMAGDHETGISIMRVVQRLDAGPVWLSKRCAITDDDTGGTLHDKLAELGGVALDQAIAMLVANEVCEQAQDEAATTYAEKITRPDRDIDWAKPVGEIERQIRALAPAPGAVGRVGELELKILAAHDAHRDANGVTGSVSQCDGSGVYVSCIDGTLCITKLQPAGKQAMDAAAFANGYGKLF